MGHPETGRADTWDEVFALDIGKVREVLGFTSITKVPRTPEFMRGGDQPPGQR